MPTSPYQDAYEEDALLHKCVQTLQKIDIEIKHKERQQIVTITGSQLIGPLTFTIDDDDEE